MKSLSIKQPVLLLAALLLVTGSPGQTPKREVTVAAAANLGDVFKELGPQFEAATGIHPVFSFASTAQLAQQIENSAPFDVFAAADVEHVEQLDKKGLLLPGSREPLTAVISGFATIGQEFENRSYLRRRQCSGNGVVPSFKMGGCFVK